MVFRIWSQDVMQANLQSEENLKRNVYLRVQSELELRDDDFLYLLKHLYRFSNAGDYWDSTMTGHLKRDLEMDQTTLDLSLFYKKEGEILMGKSGMYMDDKMNDG